MANLILRDFFFSPSAGREGGPSADSEVRQAAASGKGLKVTFAASHAGMVNGNKVMYSPQGMKNSDHTWTYPIPRPMQIHHDDTADPIGRITGARFVPYGESQVNSDHQEVFLKFRDATMKDDVLAGARMIEDAGVLGSETWKGVGELVLDAIITDADAVEKVLDGRYLGISISQRPVQAFCSICEQDWMKDGPCEHDRGEKDEDSGRRMYLIVGDTRYVEASYVNQPADEFAQTLETNPVLLGDSNEEALVCISDSLDLGLKFTLIDSFVEETQESEKKEIPDDSQEDSSDGKSEIDTKKLEETQEDSDDKGTAPKTHEEESPDLEETVAKALELLFAGEDNFDEEQADIVNNAIETIINEDPELQKEQDAKLTTEKRKALPGSSFCGPNRSFPVNDCAHYTAAKRLLGRYKGPGSKSSILSCVEGKGKKLGCSGTKKDSLDPVPEVKEQQLCIDYMDNETLGRTYLDCEKIMIARGLKFERVCEDCSEKDTKLTELEDKIPSLEDKVVALRDEWKIVIQEHIASEESHANTIAELQSLLVDYVKIGLLLSDKEREEESIDQEVKALSLDLLRQRAKELDFSQTISFVRSGVSRKPDQEVTPEEGEAKINKVDPDLSSLAKVLNNYNARYGQDLAQDYFFKQQNLGKVPKDMTLAKILSLVAE
jgi:hypothetical protein